MDLGPLLLSFEVATVATLLAAVIGIAVAALLANYRFPGRDLVDVVFTAPMVMPPTVLGYYVLVLLGRRSLLGHAFESLTGSSIVFTVTGAVVAATIGALPLVVKSVRAALEQTDPTLMLARDPAGIKPLFVAEADGCILFPDAKAEPGNEWFYLAKTVAPHLTRCQPRCGSPVPYA